MEKVKVEGEGEEQVVTLNKFDRFTDGEVSVIRCERDGLKPIVSIVEPGESGDYYVRLTRETGVIAEIKVYGGKRKAESVSRAAMRDLMRHYKHVQNYRKSKNAEKSADGESEVSP